MGQIANAKSAVHFQSAYIQIHVRWNVCRKALDFHFAQHLVQNSAGGTGAHRNARQLQPRTFTRKTLSNAIRFRSMWIS